MSNYFICDQCVSISPLLAVDSDSIIATIIPMILPSEGEDCDVRIYLINNETRLRWNGEYKGAPLTGILPMGMRVAINLSRAYINNPHIFSLFPMGVQSFSLRIECRLPGGDEIWQSESMPFIIQYGVKSLETPIRSKRQYLSIASRTMTQNVEKKRENTVENWHAFIHRDLAVSPLTLPPPMNGYSYCDSIERGSIIERGDAIVGKITASEKKVRVVKRADVKYDNYGTRGRSITGKDLGECPGASRLKDGDSSLERSEDPIYPSLLSPAYPSPEKPTRPIYPSLLSPFSITSPQPSLISPSSTYSEFPQSFSSPTPPSLLSPSYPTSDQSNHSLSITDEGSSETDSSFSHSPLTSPISTPQYPVSPVFSPIINDPLEAIVIHEKYEPLPGHQESTVIFAPKKTSRTSKKGRGRRKTTKTSSITPLLQGLSVSPDSISPIPSPTPYSLLLPDTSSSRKIFSLSKNYWTIPLKEFFFIQEPLKFTQIAEGKIELPEDAMITFSSVVTVEKGVHYDVKGEEIVLFGLPKNMKRRFTIPYCDEIAINVFFGKKLIQSDKFYLRFHSGV